MTVYVDDMCDTAMGQFRRMKMSHMIADTEEELHTMAAAIGVARRWYQGDHYDVCKSKRGAAIMRGARAVTLRQLACMAALRRRGEPMGAPETAEVRRLAWAQVQATIRARRIPEPPIDW